MEQLENQMLQEFIINTASDWNKLILDIHYSRNYSMFCKSLLKFFRPLKMKTYHINDSVRINLLTRLRLSFTHLPEHKLRHNFKHALNPLYSCSI